jgi:hypothetical protein
VPESGNWREIAFTQVTGRAGLRTPPIGDGELVRVKNEVNNLNPFACFAFPRLLVTKTARN